MVLKTGITLSYRGEDLNFVGKILETNAGSFGNSDVPLDDNSFLNEVDEGNHSNSKVIEESEVEVTVEWDDNSEAIKLDLKS